MQLTIIDDPGYIIFCIIIAGIFSCIILDILGYLQKMIGIPEPSWNILGRWGYYIIKNGILFNPKIDEMLYYIFFIFLGIKMSYFSGFIFGIITTIAPLLIFLPFTGQGIFGINTGKPIQISIVF